MAKEPEHGAVEESSNAAINSATRHCNRCLTLFIFFLPTPRVLECVSNGRRPRAGEGAREVTRGPTENSSCGAPFFVTRFREALFYYSAMFDMMEATAPRDSAGRAVLEQHVLGPCALNAIACEGSERVERPETYKQWQVRCSRAGLRQLPLNPSAVKRLSEEVRNGYHEEFVIDVDQQWLLQGWKGRILYAISTWTAQR
ncbi:hypothetical protein U9M48_000185 [Paspalum notatum var. saurae]|uniref:Uncharacterized protein n=1 Tax=Paspalum notatum var. saurae TaxID=547442 RepID=A0AAQ3PHT7_PASNO